MNEIENILGKENVKYNEPMSKHTSFRVGGNADIFLTVDNEEKLIKVINLIEENSKQDKSNKDGLKENVTFEETSLKEKITVVGNGSNLLVKDGGIRGIVIKYTSKDYKIDGETVTVSSGITNVRLANILLENELAGFEFAAGIPGTIGGAIYMNAGAYGSEMKDIVIETRYLDLETGKIKTIQNSEHNFEYRKSIFQKLNCIILETRLKLTKGNKEEIKAKMQEYSTKRRESQPLDMPSAGSTFKRGNDFITAKLIDESGLKGYSIGGAQVSTKHAGFIVNKGNATAKDIIDLINYVKEKVYEKFGKTIEEEVKIIGED